jgi:hypothetical protein
VKLTTHHQLVPRFGLYGMHPLACHTKDIYWYNLQYIDSEEDKIDTTVSTLVLIDVGGNATCSDRFLGHLQVHKNSGASNGSV